MKFPTLFKNCRLTARLYIKGIMAIPPKNYQDSLGKVPELYHRLRKLADRVGEGQLSLGMSGDLAIAIAAGSNQVEWNCNIW